MKRYLPFLIIAVVLGLSLGALAWFYSAAQPAGSGGGTSGPGANSTAAAPGETTPHIRGPAMAPVTLEEFGDFQCPPCGVLYPELKRIETDYDSRLRVIFHEYPLPQIHPNALLAAHAAEAAGLQGHFWEMHDLLYETQAKWAKADNARDIFINYAAALGLDRSRFTTDLDSTTVARRVLADEGRGDSMGVKGTPTVFVNGTVVQDMSDTGLRTAIDGALKTANR